VAGKSHRITGVGSILLMIIKHNTIRIFGCNMILGEANLSVTLSLNRE